MTSAANEMRRRNRTMTSIAQPTRRQPTRRRHFAVGVLISAVVALSALGAQPAAAAPTLTVGVSHTPTVINRGDGLATYSIVVSNSGDTPTNGTTTATATLPTGVQAGTLSGSGWTCSVTTVTCTRSNSLVGGASYPTITLAGWLDDAAADPVTISASATSSGPPAIGPVTAEDSFTFGPRTLFGLTNFMAVAHDGLGNDLTQAGGHPFVGETAFAFTTKTVFPGKQVPVEDVRNLVVDLPAGFIGNPMAAPVLCAGSDRLQYGTGAGGCPEASAVGGVQLNIASVAGIPGITNAVVFALEPERGYPAGFGFNSGGLIFILRPVVRSDGDYGLTISSPYPPQQPSLYGVDLQFCGFGVRVDPVNNRSDGCKDPSSADANPVPFLSNIPTCTGVRPVTSIHVDSYQRPGGKLSSGLPNLTDLNWRSYSAASPAVTDCDKLAFDPSVSIDPTVKAPDKPTGLDVGMHFPQDGLLDPDGLATAHLKTAVVTLPEGLTINPAAAGGLQACSDADLRLHSLEPISCPDASKVGIATATTPLLAEALSGSVYIRTQNSMDPESGEMFRIALVLENRERGISVRLPGEVRANAQTGRLTALFDNNPQLPVSDIELKIKDGSRAPLATPKACGTHEIATQLTPWSAPFTPDATASDGFSIDCAPGLGSFAPSFAAGTVSPTARGFSPFVLAVEKPDGQSDIDGVSLSMPTGLLATLKDNLGTRVGTAKVAAGPGASPFWLSGPVVLEGPYGDAPFSLRVTVPAVAGPFNLGDVVVRQKIYVDPTDARVTVVSDPLPTIVKGVQARLQNIRVDIDKPGFMLNPSDCSPKQVQATILSAEGTRADVANHFQASGCADLRFKPRLRLALKGRRQVRTGKHPAIRAVVRQRGISEAGIAKAEVRLPKSLALDVNNAQELCEFDDGTRPDLENHCPKGSIVGRARAKTPLLNRDLVGNVYFVKNVRIDKDTGNEIRTLPMIVVALRGEIAVNLVGESDTTRSGKLVNTFDNVPDAPITRFNLNIAGGKNGILAVTRTRRSRINLCKRPNRHIAEADMDGQNGKRHDFNVRMNTPCRKRRQSAAKVCRKRTDTKQGFRRCVTKVKRHRAQKRRAAQKRKAAKRSDRAGGASRS